MNSTPAILITGGAQRVGWHSAQRLASDGFRVIITCRHWRAEWPEQGPAGIEVILADFSTNEGIELFIEELKAQVSSLRAIVHNASTWCADTDLTADDFQAMYAVHMLAPYMINKACSSLLNQPQADIVHITDHDALSSDPDYVAYLATKAGLESMTRSFARRFAPAIKVNSIAPALIMFNISDTAEHKQHILEQSLLGFEPGPEVFYRTLRYLLENPYITGTCLDLNGGGRLKYA